MSELGTCPLCPKGSRPARLYGMGHCFEHYKNPEQKQERNIDPVITKEKVSDELKALDAWFTRMKEKQPKNCECCGKKIVIPYGITWKSAIAHILPKKTFKSVMLHDDNCFYACMDCHTKYDTLTNDEKKLLPVAELCRQRYQLFKDKIAPAEQRKVPVWIK
jgi:hypothetical protein